MPDKQWTLGAKLAMVGAPFLLLVLMSTAATLWVSWQLDGGAAAVNEAGRLRMQTYRMSLSVGLGHASALPAQIDEFEHSMALLRRGDPERPLLVPWDGQVSEQFASVARNWSVYRARWLAGASGPLSGLRSDTASFAAQIDAFVVGIESRLARRTSLLHLLQLSVLALAVAVAAILVFTGYVFVLEPVSRLKQAIARIQDGNFDARVDHETSAEFATLARGFNGMAANLQGLYRNLEYNVSEKTRELEEKKERLEGLYEVSALVAQATALDDLAHGFVRSVARIAHADGVTLRWSDENSERFLMLAAQGMPQPLVDAEQCIARGECHCGDAAALPGLRVVAIANTEISPLPCATAGFRTVINIPVRVHERLMGEIDLFFNAKVSPAPALRSLLEAFASHLAGAMENLRLNALEKEAAVAQERVYIARELHDSIAQSLAFIKIQVQLLRESVATGERDEIEQVLGEIDAGVRESYGDVRELLLHFRTRTNAEDIEPALATTLRKFEHQSGVPTSLAMHGQGLPLSPDRQIQVLHIVQEALSNVRKHARAAHVVLAVDQQPAWRFEVRDDGVGFHVDDDSLDETHVGLRIMKERAQRMGAALGISSTPGSGTTVVLTLPAQAPPMAASEDLTRSATR